MRAKRAIFPLLAALVVALSAPAAASAAPYPAEPPPATVSAGTVGEDGTVTFTATGFIVGEDVAIDVEYEDGDSNAAYRGGGTDVLAGLPGRPGVAALPQSVVKTVTASSTGTISVPVRLTQVGLAVLTAIGLESGVRVSATVRVVADSDDGLPTTGVDRGALWARILLGLAAVMTGAALVWWAFVWRRRPAGTPTEG